MDKSLLIGVKMHLVNLYNFFDDSITHNATKSAFLGLMGMLVNFFLKSVAIDIWLIFLLIASCAINTITGVMKAKRSVPMTYTDKILKDSIIHKWIGYMILLVALSLFMGVLFVVATKEGTLLVSEYWLNLPVVLMLLFFNTMELRSTIDNSLDLGWKVPGFVRTLPDKVNEKIDEIGNKIDLKP